MNTTISMICNIMLILLSCWQVPAAAHNGSDSYLTLTIIDQKIQGQWDIALHDLDLALSLERLGQEGQSKPAADDVTSKLNDTAGYAFRHLTLSNEGQLCPINITKKALNQRADGAYAGLSFHATCLQTATNALIPRIYLQYRLNHDRIDRRYLVC